MAWEMAEMVSGLEPGLGLVVDLVLGLAIDHESDLGPDQWVVLLGPDNLSQCDGPETQASVIVESF
jgi:hypothetical protein